MKIENTSGQAVFWEVAYVVDEQLPKHHLTACHVCIMRVAIKADKRFTEGIRKPGGAGPLKN